jgi:hypothetical protein
MADVTVDRKWQLTRYIESTGTDRDKVTPYYEPSNNFWNLGPMVPGII